ncbi:MAG: deoxyribose-phosphate aldolase [Clostridia bacterium]|nr:deoxyribose-phosphate aldolase [Clostridia bacterium]
MTKEQIKNIIAHTDHTVLSQTATQLDIIEACNEAENFGAASVCVAPCFVEFAADFSSNIDVCTVIGFPNGYSSRNTKIIETLDAIRSGASEIDMVINLGDVKAGNFDAIFEEINAVAEICDGRTLKVIVEACLLTDEEKIKLCEIISASNADYIKTSTGFAGGVATEHDVALFKAHLTNGKKIKAAGGIKTFEQAQRFLELGADRIGSSTLIKIASEEL